MPRDEHILNEQYQCALEMRRPFIQLRPKMFPDGDMWCALYGDNLQEGVCGFGKTPEEASYNFDIAWLNQKASNKAESKEHA